MPGSPSTRSAWPTAFCPRTGAAISADGAQMAAGSASTLPPPPIDHEQSERCLQRQQAHSERSEAAPAIPCRGLPCCAARLSLTKPFSVDHMLGPEPCLWGQQVFQFVRMMAHNKVYLRCAQLANASRSNKRRRRWRRKRRALRRTLHRTLHGTKTAGRALRMLERQAYDRLTTGASVLV